MAPIREGLDIDVHTREDADRARILDGSDANTGAVRPLVLAVDDDAVQRELIGAVLRRAGFDVALAADGQSAISTALALRPDVIVTDALMPTISGFEMIARLQPRLGNVRVPTIVVSGSTELATRLDAFDSGADDFLAKPFEPAALIARINAQLRIADHWTWQADQMLGELRTARRDMADRSTDDGNDQRDDHQVDADAQTRGDLARSLFEQRPDALSCATLVVIDDLGGAACSPRPPMIGWEQIRAAADALDPSNPTVDLGVGAETRCPLCGAAGEGRLTITTAGSWTGGAAYILLGCQSPARQTHRHLAERLADSIWLALGDQVGSRFADADARTWIDRVIADRLYHFVFRGSDRSGGPNGMPTFTQDSGHDLHELGSILDDQRFESRHRSHPRISGNTGRADQRPPERGRTDAGTSNCVSTAAPRSLWNVTVIRHGRSIGTGRPTMRTSDEDSNSLIRKGVGLIAVAAIAAFVAQSFTGGASTPAIRALASDEPAVTSGPVVARAPATTAAPTATDAGGQADVEPQQQPDEVEPATTTGGVVADQPPATVPAFEPVETIAPSAGDAPADAVLPVGAGDEDTTSADASTSAAPVADDAPQAAVAPYPTGADGNPLPVIVVYGPDTITMTGFVPSEAARQRLGALANANSQHPAELVDHLMVNPQVPIGVGVRVIELDSPRFPDGQSELTPEHAAQFDRVAAVMRALPNVTVLVIGHSDQRGDASRNWELSDARAGAVVNYLTYLGIEPTRLSSRAAGETDLLTLNDDATSLALNRRTEFVFYGTLID